MLRHPSRIASIGHINNVIAFPEEGKEGKEYLRILNEITSIPSKWGGQGNKNINNSSSDFVQKKDILIND